MNQLSLYKRLGGYRAISAFANNLLPRLMNDSQLGRFWKNTGGSQANKAQRLIGHLCFCAGWPNYSPDRTMEAINISELDWFKFMVHTGATLEALQVPKREFEEVISFVLSIKGEVVTI